LLYLIQVEHFGRDEPLNKSSGLADDPESLAELASFWRDILLPQRVSIVALQEGTPGAALEKGTCLVFKKLLNSIKKNM
jgi:hypothetical protein